MKAAPVFDYKVALIILYDPQNRLLLQHRTKDAKLLADHWAFFGGGLKAQETPLEGLKREAFEEINHIITDPELVIEQPFKENDTEGYLYIYIEAFNKDKSSLKLNEGQGWGWFDEAGVNRLKMIERDRQIVKNIFRYLRNGKIRKS